MTKNFPKIEFNVAFQVPRSVGSFFPFKDNIKTKEAQANVVYQITCETCNEQYIGMTSRTLNDRLYDHFSTNTTAIGKHKKENPSHLFIAKNVEILDRANSLVKLKVKELLHILKRKPKMNIQLNQQSQYDINTILVKAYPQFRK